MNIKEPATSYERSAWYVPALDVNSPEYGTFDYDDDGGDRKLCLAGSTTAPNAWSSIALDALSFTFPADEVHLPCFDLDKTLMAHEERMVAARFPDYRLVPSSTPGHFHVYSDTPLDGETYFGHLQDLADFDIVEQGYVNACRVRESTFVRMAHITKKVTL